jgi:hypothetical protein
MSESQEVKEIRRVYAGLESICRAYFPKSEPYLIHDLLRRLKKNPKILPIYMVEVFTKPGVDTEAARRFIFNKTGMLPAIYDKGTHFVTNQKLTLEMLKEISDSADVLEVAGDYTGNITARGSSHVHSDDCPIQDLDYAY